MLLKYHAVCRCSMVNVRHFIFFVEFCTPYHYNKCRRCNVRYHDDVYKCLYKDLKKKCNATAAVIYTNYHVTTWKHSLATIDCYISE